MVMGQQASWHCQVDNQFDLFHICQVQDSYNVVFFQPMCNALASIGCSCHFASHAWRGGRWILYLWIVLGWKVQISLLPDDKCVCNRINGKKRAIHKRKKIVCWAQKLKTKQNKKSGSINNSLMMAKCCEGKFPLLTSWSSHTCERWYPSERERERLFYSTVSSRMFEESW